MKNKVSPNNGIHITVSQDAIDALNKGHAEMRADWDQEMQGVDPDNAEQVMDHAMNFIFNQFNKFNNEK